MVLGIAGIFLPVLPTVPFLLLAAFCYSRGSERCHQWLLNHNRFGSVIREWHEGQVIRPRTKVIAISMLWICISYPLFFLGLALYLQLLLGVIALGVSWFIFSRPSS